MGHYNRNSNVMTLHIGMGNFWKHYFNFDLIFNPRSTQTNTVTDPSFSSEFCSDGFFIFIIIYDLMTKISNQN
jgi:hypothetical protein